MARFWRGDVVVPIILEARVEKERVVERAVKQLAELKELLSGLPLLPGKAPAEP